MLANRLQKGDTIGVIAPDKALKEQDRVFLENATKFFESLGLKVKYGKYLYSEDTFSCGTAKERAEDLNNMFSDKEVKAIFTAKGGDVAEELLPYIDFENIKNNPKIFLGMSNITVLLCAINKITGLVTFHCQDFLWFGKDSVTDYDKNEIIDKLFNGNNTIIPYDNREFYDFKEEVTGTLYGTNASCLLKLLNTEYMPDLNDSILFLEDYVIDIDGWRDILTKYEKLGVLNKAVVFGYLYKLQCVENNKYSIVDELRKINKSVPIIKTNDFGHIHGNSIIPIGVRVKLNPKDNTITVDKYLI